MGSIRRNNKYFDACINTGEALFVEGHLNDCANYLQQLSSFAWGNCTGFYASWRLESILNKIGESLHGQRSECNEKNTKRKVLHVATGLYETGGHTRLLFNWIMNDINSSHSVVLTRQQECELPNKLINEFGLEKKLFYHLKANTTVCEKSIELRNLSFEYDFVILHIHPDDVIPVIAFSHNERKPTILFVNHADHIFWLGVSVSDFVLQIREPVLSIDVKRRGINKQFLLPIIIENTSLINEEISSKARQKLEIPDDRLLLLTTGSEYKYKPDDKYNFYESILKIVKENSNVIVYIAGVGSVSEYARKYEHPQIFFKGLISQRELCLYEDACDIYVEGFPLSSFTALLQPALKGKAVHLMYDPASVTVLFNEMSGNGFSYTPNLTKWHEELSKLINDTDYRRQLQTKQYDYLKSNYSKELWRNKLEKIYKDLQLESHEIKRMINDIAFSTRDELFLASLDLRTNINHFLYCNRLSTRNKILHIFKLRYKVREVNTGRIKGIIAFLLNL